MRHALHLAALAGILLLATAAWLALAGTMRYRSESQRGSLAGDVAELWGAPLAQKAPTLVFRYPYEVEREETVTGTDGKALVRRWRETAWTSETVAPDSTKIAVDLRLDQRRKGLIWFPLYDVDFGGKWTYTHDVNREGTLAIKLALPDASGVYDDFRFVVNGTDRSPDLTTTYGEMTLDLPVTPGEVVAFEIRYRSRGAETWSYLPSEGVGTVEAFSLAMTTDFAEIDFPPYTMSPSAKERTPGGWKLDWDFTRIVTGHGMGMVMPVPVQPGPLAASMSLSAPISLGLFTLWIYVLSLLRGLEIHPVNHLMLAGAFFSFHLLFGYSADHLPVEVAFGLSAAVSLVLVTTYLRLVVGAGFAFVHAGLAQLVYLVGFSLAHFWDGFTGLTVTVLGILTLFALMQLTGRIRWSAVFAGGAAEARG